MDFGKEKFGGPFTEEEVEDVKTVLRLLPLVVCICLSGNGLSLAPLDLLPKNSITNVWLTYGINTVLAVYNTIHSFLSIHNSSTYSQP